jgi:hypothetical protein
MPVTVVDDADWNNTLMVIPIGNPFPRIGSFYKVYPGMWIDHFHKSRISLVHVRLYLKEPKWFRRQIFLSQGRNKQKIPKLKPRMIQKKWVYPATSRLPKGLTPYGDKPSSVEIKVEANLAGLITTRRLRNSLFYTNLCEWEDSVFNPQNVQVVQVPPPPPPPPPPLGRVGKIKIVKPTKVSSLRSGVSTSTANLDFPFQPSDFPDRRFHREEDAP